MFGYEPGAFTGASREGKAGLFEQADGGTLFLDEIGDISPRIQRGLLRVLQEGEVLRIGGNHIRRVDVRIIAATNRNLTKMAADNLFREDLLYRIKQGYIRMPSLRERKDDIPILIDHLIHRESFSETKITPALKSKLTDYIWPGNIRELKNILICMMAISSSDTISLKDVPDGMFILDFFEPENQYEMEDRSKQSAVSEKEITALESIESLLSDGLIPTRQRLSEFCTRKGINLTPAQARRIIEDFKQKGWCSKEKNRYGLSITVEGRQIIRSTRR